MAPMIPDCGIFATPRREPSLKILKDDLKSSPTPASTPLKSHKITSLFLSSSPGTSEITLDSGFSFGFYKLSNNLLSPPPRVATLPITKKVKRTKDGINKGVGHNIKKPNLKAKEKLKKKTSVKIIAKRLKESTYTPYLPSSRSPVKTPSIKGFRKRRTLSSPGMSLLDVEETSDFVPEPKDAKFFTSRSRAAATVHIGKNIKLSAKYGEVTLKQREGGLVKKNIGRLVEVELGQYLGMSNNNNLEKVESLPTVVSNPRPAPTRVPSTPSPTKKTPLKRRPRTPSPRKSRGFILAKAKSVVDQDKGAATADSSAEGELLDMEKILDDWNTDSSLEKDNSAPQKSLANGSSKLDPLSTPTRRSPRKNGVGDTQSKRTPHKLGGCNSPTRSPRRAKACGTPTRRSPRKLAESLTPSRRTPGKRTPSKLVSEGTPSQRRMPSTRRTPSKLCDEGAPSKRTPRRLHTSSPARVSPRKCSSSPKKNEHSDSNPASKTEESNGVKMFPIFDPKTRLSDQIASSPQGNISGKNVKKKSAMEPTSQMVIDAGQRRYGAEQCPECGLVYEVGSMADQVSHKSHHDRYIHALKLPNWKKENQVRSMDYQGGRVIMISEDDPEYCWRKVEEVREIVDEILGFPETRGLVKESTKVFLKIVGQRIVGVLIAEQISKAYRIIPQKAKSQEYGRLACCSETPSKVWGGVSRIWVVPSERRNHVASTLVDVMRENMVQSDILNRDQIAFSDPTESGMIFAEKYSEKLDFLVYRRSV